jgi:uncharacterized membrane protein YkgB
MNLDPAIRVSVVARLMQRAAHADRLGIAVTRWALVLVLVWIGALKAAPYEAEGIVPFVANSPVMRFFYRTSAPEYRRHANAEGQLFVQNREWHERNGTYVVARGLGVVIVALGVMIGMHPWVPQVGALGSFLVVLMSFVTLSLLVTTPEAWVPALGAEHHGFPFLAGPGRLVVKDAIMMGGAIVTMADSAQAFLRRSRLDVHKLRAAAVSPDAAQSYVRANR